MKSCRQINKSCSAFFQWFWEAKSLKQANFLEQWFYQLLLYFKSLVAYWLHERWWIPKEKVCNSKSPKKGLKQKLDQTYSDPSKPLHCF